ncbi:MAG: hypothetical protein AAB900_01850 [Patescibacteria group bacterium]
MSNKLEDVIREAKTLPLWAQFTGLLLAAVAAFAAFWAIYLIYYPPIPQNVFSKTANATSTIPLSDILYRAEDFKTIYEVSNFLKPYDDKYVSGDGSFENFFGEGKYYVVINFRVGWHGWLQPYQIACALKESGQDQKETLMLLRKGQTIYFVGTFKNGNLNGLYSPIINDCSLLKFPL